MLIEGPRVRSAVFRGEFSGEGGEGKRRRNEVNGGWKRVWKEESLGVTDKQSREKRPRHISFLAHERPSIEEDRAKKSNFQAIEAARLIKPEFARLS